MKWRRIRRNLAAQSAWALVVSALLARFGEMPFALAAGVLLFNWPVAEFIILAIRARNSWNANDPYEARWSWRSFFRTVGFVLVSALMFALWRQTRFLPTLAWTTLLLTTAGALLGIAAEWEDNRAGGWENPKPR